MSVYKPAKSRFYQYDFRYKGKRYTGSTGVETLRKAEAVERHIRGEVALGLHDDQAGMTLDQGAGQWWEEVGKHLRTAKDVERRLETLLRLMGKDTRLVDINTRKVSVAIEKRRGETYQKAPDKPGKPAKRYPVANATVNADIISPLRRILRRAETVWEVKPIAKIDWKALTLAEPEPEIRLYTADQRAAWIGQCDPVAGQALEYLLRYGLRLNELFFAPAAYLPADEFAGPRLAINKRKRGVMLLPLREDDARDVAARVGRAQAADLETIWFEEIVLPACGKRPEKIILEPLSYYGLQARLRSAAKRAGINMARVIHGARHHAGTMMLGKTGNLKLTQQLLGHADIKSTLRYAHALEADLRSALEESPPQESRASQAKSARKR
ncbi:tyrosine-type recombinase/integrase [Caulobacter sp. CCG-8]|uniref:tyrosine-type recombinase/integrase n=1 Tax=Caulobacter sp. CCG-8 TaxID=3127958 RepID=UPI00307CCF34